MATRTGAEASPPGRAYLVATAALIALGAVAAVTVATTFALTAWRSDDEGAPVVVVVTPAPAPTATPTPDPRPPGVSPEAARIDAPVALGSLQANAPDVRLFFTLRCEGELLTVATTREVVYAELPCNRYWLADDVIRPYLGRPVRIEIGVGAVMLLRFDATPGPIRFEAESIWMESR